MSAYKAKIKKAIIPIAGMGTRMLPVTKAIPKEMLPLVDQPLIQYVVDECVAAGIHELILITRSSKHCIENHFNNSVESETILEKRVKPPLLDKIQFVCPPYVKIMEVRQEVARGLGHAVMCAYPLVGDEPVAVILPDVIISKYESNLMQDNLAEMLIRFEKTGNSQIMVKTAEDVTLYGVIDFQGGIFNPGDSFPILNIVEKPNLSNAPSNKVVVGRYLLSSDIWPLLAKYLAKDLNNEINFTSSISNLIQINTVEAYYLKGTSYDCGNKLGYMKAFVEYGIRHPSLGSDFIHWLKIMLNNKNYLL